MSGLVPGQSSRLEYCSFKSFYIPWVSIKSRVQSSPTHKILPMILAAYSDFITLSTMIRETWAKYMTGF